VWEALAGELEGEIYVVGPGGYENTLYIAFRARYAP
jgi:hypothetical protein